MKKATDKDILKGIAEHGADVKALAKALSLSESNVFYRIRKLKTKGKLDADGCIIANKTEPEQSKLESVAVNREDSKADQITQVIYSQYDADEFIPERKPDYKYRDVDAVIKKYSERCTPVLLIGDAGAGKTEAIRQYSADNRKPFLRVACDDSAILKEFIGRREILNGTTYFRTGLLIELLQKPSIILFDEFNALPSSRLFFLHELLDNRRIFIKDADGGKVVNVHPDCKIFLACNPNNARYSGTNKINVALADRCAIVGVEQFSIDEINGVFETGKPKITRALRQFYSDASRVIKEQNLRVVFSLRAVKRCADSIKSGDSIKDALQYGFYNIALATASDRERDALEQIARVCFGANNFDGNSQEGNSNV